MSNPQALIIDDNHKNVNVLARLLSYEGLSNIQINNPNNLDSALDQIDDLQVVFLDLEMPEMDGYDVLEKLKSDDRFQSIPIIAYTVHVGEIRTAHTKGFNGFLGKPIDSDKFPDQLARILNDEAVWETP
jgi:two-component system, cell cycle response regulator DivK